MPTEFNFSSAAVEKLAYYVYFLIDPQDGRPFYVGKGKGSRCLSHFTAHANKATANRIRNIRRGGKEPRLDILVHGLRDEQTALKVEAAAIELLDLQNLTNQVRGHGIAYGRKGLHELLAVYNPDRVEIAVPTILISINQLYRSDMEPIELYDATRGIWRASDKSRERPKAKYAFAIYKNIVREVYRIESWFPAGKTFSTRNPNGVRSRSSLRRWEFVGRLAESNVRNQYLSKSVKHYLTAKQWSIKYVV